MVCPGPDPRLEQFMLLCAPFYDSGHRVDTEPPRFPPLEMGFESPRITSEQSRELPRLNLHRTLKER